MAKRVFFSFHYKDVIDFRANVVRNHWVCKNDREEVGFFDSSIWESAKKTGEIALKRLINSGLTNTSNTCVLIGTETYQRPWVKYEIFKSIDVGNHIFGVHINGIKGKDKNTKNLGRSPFEWLGLRFNKDGTSADPIEYNGKNWIGYNKIPPLKIKPNIEEEYWNKSYKLSHFFKTYKWYKDDGYNNFLKWVK